MIWIDACLLVLCSCALVLFVECWFGFLVLGTVGFGVCDLL